MKVKTSELIGPALDWAVAKAEDQRVYIGHNHTMTGVGILDAELVDMDVDGSRDFYPSRDWAQGGPIMEREKIDLETRWHTRGCGVRTEFKEWAATHPKNHGGLIRYTGYGPTQPNSSQPCAAMWRPS